MDPWDQRAVFITHNSEKVRNVLLPVAIIVCKISAGSDISTRE